MGAALGPVLPIVIGLTVSPMTIVAVVLMLASRRAASNALAFLAGWAVGIALVGSLVLLLAGGGTARDTEPATWVGIVKIALGLGLLLLAVRQVSSWRSRDQEPSTPKWMAAIDGFAPPKAFGLALLLGAVNPKNLLLVVSAALTIAHAGVDRGEQFAVLAVFVVLASLGVAVPVVIYLAMGQRSERLLADLRGWLIANNAAIMTALLLVLGMKMIGDGIAGLA